MKTKTLAEKMGYRYFGQLSEVEQAEVRKQVGGWSEIDLNMHAWRKTVGTTANGKTVVTWSSHYSA